MKCDQRTKNDKVVDDTSNEEKNEEYLPTSEERRQKKFPPVTKCLLYFALKSHYIKSQNRQVK